MKLRDIIALLKSTYSSSIGVEFMHISDAEQRRWLHESLERTGGNYAFAAEERKRILLEAHRRPKAWSATCTPSTSARSASRWKAATA